MNELGTGAGLAAIAFWGFLAAAVLGAYWDSIKKREAKHETLRRIVESGQTIDEELVNKMLSIGNSGGNADRDFIVTAMWILPIAPGLLVFAYLLGSISPEAQVALTGVAAMLAVMGVGFYIAGKCLQRWYPAQEQ